MRTKNRMLRSLALLIVDIVSVLAAYKIAGTIRFAAEYYVNRRANLSMLYIAILFTIILDVFSTRDKELMRRNTGQEFLEVVLQNVYLFGIVVVYCFMTHSILFVSRLMTGWFFVLRLFLQFLLRTILKKITIHHFASSESAIKILLVTERDNRNSVMERFHPGAAHRIIGTAVVDKDKVDIEIDGETIETDLKDLASSLVTHPFDEVFFVTPHVPHETIRNLLYDFVDMGVVCRYGLDMPDTSNIYSKVTVYGDYPSVSYGATRMNPAGLIVKRFFDIIGALVGLVFCGIIYIFLAPAIKKDSPGPVIFAQTRIGKNGRRFKFYKFRSMYIDAEERKKELMAQNEMQGLMFKMEDDPRITKVGKFIRKTSLDEFPQFWNVLKGDMSLVGTRPPTEDEFSHYNEHYRRRMSMTPGITGLWQVSGRSDIENFDDVLKLDLEYIDNWSLGLDAKILFETVAVVFKHKGAK